MKGYELSFIGPKPLTQKKPNPKQQAEIPPVLNRRLSEAFFACGILQE